MKRLALAIAACLAIAPSASAQPAELERVYTVVHFYQFQDGGFWWKSRDELLSPDAVNILTGVCARFAYDCRTTAEAMLAVAEGVTETSRVGIEIRGFVNSPPGYQICRAFTGADQWTIQGPFNAQIIREGMRNGIDYLVVVPRGFRATDQFLDFRAVLEFVPATADLVEAGCWPDYEIPWLCSFDGCSFYTQRTPFAIENFTEATGVTATGPASVQWGIPVLESGPDGGRVVYEFTVVAPGNYRLEFDYAATDERPLQIILNDLPVTQIGLRLPNAANLEPRPLLPQATDPERPWTRVGPMIVRHGLNRLEISSAGPFPLILQMRLEPF